MTELTLIYNGKKVIDSAIWSNKIGYILELEDDTLETVSIDVFTQIREEALNKFKSGVV